MQVRLQARPDHDLSRWKGVDQLRRPLEIDVVAELTDGRWMSGAVKWDSVPVARSPTPTGSPAPD